MNSRLREELEAACINYSIENRSFKGQWRHQAGVTKGVYGIRIGFFPKIREITENWSDDGYDLVAGGVSHRRK